ncbi:MAG: hypothetical protein HC900_07145 [Methylacidiphilales bacterium]|nr:hypothetical protein [Candidatus Methylacidiphilales bacterium]
MDTGLTIKPASTTTQIGIGREDTLPMLKVGPTELAPSQTVTASGSSTGTQAQPGSPSRQGTEARLASAAAGTYGFLDGQVLLDPQSREVIFRMIDVRTRRVVEQVPDQAILRLRAYTNAIAFDEMVTETAPRAYTAA